MMELRQVRYFLAVADSGSFSAAARHLQISQPSLSAQIRVLEAELGIKLLERHARGVRPTAAGASFLVQARSLLAAADEMVRSAGSMAKEVFGTIRLGLTVSAASLVAAPILQKVTSVYPRIQFAITEALSSHLMTRVAEDELDLALAFSPDFIDGVRGEILAIERFYLCVAPDHPLAGESPILAEEFLPYPLLLPPPRHEMSLRLASCGNRVGMKPRRQHVVGSVGVIRSLVEAGVGISILPYSAVWDAVQAQKISARPIASSELARQMCLIYSARRSLSRAELETAQIVRGVIATKIDDPMTRWTLPSA